MNGQFGKDRIVLNLDSSTRMSVSSESLIFRISSCASILLWNYIKLNKSNDHNYQARL
jgi:hypothetical protein